MKRTGDIQPETGATYTPPITNRVAGLKKPSREFCKAEAAKLGSKPFAPTDPRLIAVVIDTIANAAQSEAHAKRIVDVLLETCDRWPDVTDIREVAAQTRDVELRPGANCELCGGSGYAPATRVVRGIRYEGSRRCSCWTYQKVER